MTRAALVLASLCAVAGLAACSTDRDLEDDPPAPTAADETGACGAFGGSTASIVIAGADADAPKPVAANGSRLEVHLAASDDGFVGHLALDVDPGLGLLVLASRELPLDAFDADGASLDAVCAAEAPTRRFFVQPAATPSRLTLGPGEAAVVDLVIVTVP